jgi:hypothetical protein
MNPALWLEPFAKVAKHISSSTRGVKLAVPRQCSSTPRRGSQSVWLRVALYCASLALASLECCACHSHQAQFKRFGSRSEMKHHRGFEQFVKQISGVHHA